MEQDKPCCIPEVVSGILCGIDVIHKTLLNKVWISPNPSILHKWFPLKSLQDFIWWPHILRYHFNYRCLGTHLLTYYVQVQIQTQKKEITRWGRGQICLLQHNMLIIFATMKLSVDVCMMIGNVVDLLIWWFFFFFILRIWSLMARVLKVFF